jgi:1D-myo-inositol-tetrakisphosphate 5-kinase/inositol-polyphosphate multikinase
MVESGLETIENRSNSNNNHINNNSNNKNEIVDDSVLPHNCMPLAHQVAGHFFGKGKTKLGLLQSNDGFVLKPVQSPPRGEREHTFFKRLFQSDENLLNSDETELRNLLPTYRGSLNHNDSKFLTRF